MPYIEKMASMDINASRRRNVVTDESREMEREFSKHSRTSSSSTVSGTLSESVKEIRTASNDVYNAANSARWELPSDSKANDAVNIKREELNFGTVMPDLYRSACPGPEDHIYLKSLGLKTILSLSDKERPESYKIFMQENNIKHIIVDMAGTKKVAIPLQTMKIILGVVMNRSNYPMLIHCNHGKHRTGCVVAIMRKIAGSMCLDTILNEYKKFAGEKARECDLEYITAFSVLDVQDVLEEITYGKTPNTGGSSTPMLSSKMGRLVLLVAVSLFLCWLHVVWFA